MTSSPHCRRTRFNKAFLGLAAAVVAALIGLAPAAADSPPYTLPVSLPSASADSPTFDAAAPYTPAVLSLIAQLEPTNPPTLAQVQNLTTVLHDAASPDCHNVGPVGARTASTRPATWRARRSLRPRSWGRRTSRW